MDSKRLELLKNRSFLLFVSGYAVSYLGNGMQFIANSWLAMTLSGKAYSVAIVLAASAIPGILLSPFLGVLVDRFDRRLLASMVDLARAVVLLVIPALWWLGVLEPWHLYLVTFIVAVGDAIYGPTSMSLIREVIPSDLLLHANSTSMLASQVGALAGAGIGGLVVAVYSPVYVMVINSASFVVSSMTTFLMRKGTVLPQGNASRPHGVGEFTEKMKEGFRYINEHRNVIVFYAMMLFHRSTYSTLNVLLAPFSKNTLNVGATGFGYIDASYAIGAIGGNLLLPWVSRKQGASPTMTLGLALLSGSVLLVALSRNLWMAMAGYLVAGISFQSGILFMTGAQHRTDLVYQGRVQSLVNVVFNCLSLIIYFVMGYLLEALSIRWVYGLLSLVLAGGTMLVYSLFVRRQVDGASSLSPGA